MATVELAFSGPSASLTGGTLPCLSEDAVGRQPGIHLWTVPIPAGELVYYTGQTARTLARRMDEHLAEQLSGRYRLYEPDTFMQGERMLLWQGVHGPGSEPHVLAFVERLPSLAPTLAQFVLAMRFRVAPISCENRTRRRIEAAIALYLRGMSDPVGSFQDADVRYSPRLPDGTPLAVRLAWEHGPLGVPEALDVWYATRPRYV